MAMTLEQAKQDDIAIKKQAVKEFVGAVQAYCAMRAQGGEINSKEAPDVELAALYKAQSDAYSDVESYCALLIGLTEIQL